jgi:selenocysteine lyase/cysteine desulfurase
MTAPTQPNSSAVIPVDRHLQQHRTHAGTAHRVSVFTDRYTDLDLAATTPCLPEVWAAVERALPWYGSVHRGAGAASLVSSQLLELSRQTVHRFFGGRDDDVVVFTRNTTDALNLLARSLAPGTATIGFVSEHHANLLPWRQRGAVVLPVPPSPAAAVLALDTALSRLPPGPRLVFVTAASNVTGEVWPVEELVTIAHAHGARIAVDAAQLAAHAPLSLATLDVDYLAASGHKMYAPFGAGVLIGRRDWFDAAEPYLAGGGSVRHVDADTAQWRDSPQRHEGGTPNLLGAVALAAACEHLRRISFPVIAAHEQRLLGMLDRGLASIRGVHRLRLWPESPRVGIAAFTVEGQSAALIAAALSSEHQVGVRAGAFCAHPLVTHLLGQTVGCSPDAGQALRASIGLTTTPTDIARLIAGLRDLVRRGPTGRYVETSDGWRAHDDHRRITDVAAGVLSGPSSRVGGYR